jgi:AcrR family transcriptional regulator
VPYPAKTDRQKILAAALEQLYRNGLRQLSLRALAGTLGLAPNALYRYFADRAQLEAALAGEAAGRLHTVLRRATGRKAPEEAIRSMARAYVRFAREEHRLYEIMMICPGGGEGPTAHEELWTFVVEQVTRLSGPAHAREAAVALWAFLHGMVALEAAEVFGEQRPANSFDFGLDSWLAAVGETSAQEPGSGPRR